MKYSKPFKMQSIMSLRGGRDEGGREEGGMEKGERREGGRKEGEKREKEQGGTDMKERMSVHVTILDSADNSDSPLLFSLSLSLCVSISLSLSLSLCISLHPALCLSQFYSKE